MDRQTYYGRWMVFILLSVMGGAIITAFWPWAGFVVLAVTCAITAIWFREPK